MRRRGIDPDWLARHYPVATDVYEVQDLHEREFGWRPTKHSVYMAAHRLGIGKRRVGRGDRAERTVTWCREPEMERWMLEHDHGQRTDALSEEFRERFGFGLSRWQISSFRSTHGTQTRTRPPGSNGRGCPLGSEREAKGLVYVKVREHPTKPMSKDNWRLKSVITWEEAHGVPFPEDCNAYFADGDRHNFSPDNIVAVPKRVIGVMNAPGFPRWHDRESLEACVALATLKVGTRDVAFSVERTCVSCGTRYVPTEAQRHYRDVPRTCPACAASYRRANRKHVVFDRDEMRRRRAEGESVPEIAAALGCSDALVYRVLSGDERYS